MALIFEDIVKENRQQFVDKVKNISSKLGINPNWLMAVMYSESGLKHRIQNTSYPVQGGYATGLIQFVPSTMTMLGVTAAQLIAMTNVEQLDYVYKYFKPFSGKIKSYADLYLVTFFPAAVGKPKDWVIETSRIPAYSVAKINPGFDLNKDMKITVGEFETAIIKKFPDKIQEYLKKKAYP